MISSRARKRAHTHSRYLRDDDDDDKQKNYKEITSGGGKENK